MSRCKVEVTVCLCDDDDDDARLRDGNPRRLLDRVRAVSRQRWQVAAAIAAVAAAAMTDSLLEGHFHVIYVYVVTGNVAGVCRKNFCLCNGFLNVAVVRHVVTHRVEADLNRFAS